MMVLADITMVPTAMGITKTEGNQNSCGQGDGQQVVAGCPGRWFFSLSPAPSKNTRPP